MPFDTGLYLLTLGATLAAFATFVAVVFAGRRQRRRECRLDPEACGS